MKQKGFNVPLIGNVYVLSYGTAKIMNANKLPGCVVTDKLLKEIEEERNALDKGKEARLLRAAKLFAVLKGMGYNGVHIGGHNLSYEDLEFIIEKGKKLVGRWQDLVEQLDYPLNGGFYYYKRY